MIHLVQKLPAAEVTAGATVIIPLRGPLENEAENYSYLGKCSLLYCVLEGEQPSARASGIPAAT